MKRHPTRILPRYAVNQVLGPILLFGGATLALELLGTDFYQLVGTIVDRSIPSSVVLRMLALRIPYWLVHTIPVALVMGVLMGLGRAERNLEYRALITSGMSPTRLLFPILGVATILGGLAWWLAENVVPETLREYQTLLSRHAPGIDNDKLPDRRLFYAREGGEIVYLGRRDEASNTATRLLIIEPDQNGEIVLTLARSAFVKDGELVLEGGTLYPAHSLEMDEIPIEPFDQRPSGLDPGLIRLVSGAGDALTQFTPDLQQDLERAKEWGESRERLSRKVMGLHLKFALPLSNLLLALVVFPLALWGGPSRGYSHLFMGLGLFGAFFGLLNLAKSMGQQDIFNPVFAAWMPNMIFLAVGIWLLGRMPR
ncbi:LptF/LptG family permease [bacterium]|nr:LptF/LptG family permease [bacterium]